MKIKYGISSVLFFSLLLLAATLCSAGAEDEAARIQKAYEKIKDVKGSFVQKSHVRDLKRTDTYQGRFFIKPPKMKWEYQGEKAQTVFITGEEIIIYQKKENQAFQSRFDRSTYGQAPIALLGGFGDIRKEFEVTMKGDRLHLKPKKPMGTIAYIEITPAEGDFPIGALTIVDSLSNRIDVQLKDVTVNTGLKDRIFEFTPPEGVNILRQ
ncbi:MAG: outer membrane lipoprotein carrier protein LolA [Alphaproteobacteria bacterium]|uniref:Outer membrane lipoprotein carrier protein LolA n=1 Tax=Candidatus Nitrobium versatile TaxID=2884831 RepID=A0A953M2V9_9BACT|nr:outer membrane lipoprotein carrier protein LolA [Candidatus Nitrobium versatile]